MDVLARAPDRVFLHRAAECAQARRLLSRINKRTRAGKLLAAIADASWVERPYGGIDTDESGGHEELTDERGVHSVYEATERPKRPAVEELAKALLERDRRSRESKQPAIIRQVFMGPCFWLGVDPEQELQAREHHPADVEVDRSDQRFLHVHLRELTWANDDPDWSTRALTLKAMRRALLRESILARILPEYEDRGDETLADLLVRRATEDQRERRESLLRRIGVFVEDLATCSGDISKPNDARGALYEATKTTDAVALVGGGTANETRSRRFQGFNSPLLPEILVCGQVAQEGIDLHRHCRHVVHYDLPWNPATLEQRTGRIDRIGSETQRLRQLASAAAESDVYLEVDAPYLAGTYDERVFEELRLRAQTLEVLLGGDLAGSVGAASADDDTVDEERARGLVPLPQDLADDLRVDLAVWHPAAPCSILRNGHAGPALAPPTK